LGCGSGDRFTIFQSECGRSFTVYPCGFGAAYVGRGHGSMSLPAQAFTAPEALYQETRALKASLAALVHRVRDAALQSLTVEDVAGMWAILLNYWWLKVGSHEYAHDVTYVLRAASDIRAGDIRDYVIMGMQRAVLPGEVPLHRFPPQALQHFIRHHMAWNRFACCAFDCGPIMLGREGYVSYETLSEARRQYLANHPSPDDTMTARRLYAREALADHCDFLLLYDQTPISQMHRYGGFRTHRDALYTRVADVQPRLNELIVREEVALQPYTYLPAGSSQEE
jgi:hypothetical protein